MNVQLNIILIPFSIFQLLIAERLLYQNTGCISCFLIWKTCSVHFNPHEWGEIM